MELLCLDAQGCTDLNTHTILFNVETADKLVITEPENYLFYLELWKDAVSRYAASVNAYCFMPSPSNRGRPGIPLKYQSRRHLLMTPFTKYHKKVTAESFSSKNRVREQLTLILEAIAL